MSLIRRNFFNDWIDPFDMIYDPFLEMNNRMRQRIRRNAPYSYPSPVFSNRWSMADESLDTEKMTHFPTVSDDGKSVSLKFKFPDHVDSNKINVSTQDRDIIVKVQDKIEKDNSSTEYSYYHRSSLPPNTDFESMKAFMNDDNKDISIQAALKEADKTTTSRQIPIQSEKQQQIKN